MVFSGLGIADKFNQSSDQYEPLRNELTRTFKTKTRDDWEAVFKNYDACVTPVLDLGEAPLHPHNITRQSFFDTKGNIGTNILKLDSVYWSAHFSKGHVHGGHFNREGKINTSSILILLLSDS